MVEHLCHAAACKTPVPRRMFMCARHWRMVPKPLQDAIWATYVPGQERGRITPTSDYFKVTREAIRVVRRAESADTELGGDHRMPTDPSKEADDRLQIGGAGLRVGGMYMGSEITRIVRTPVPPTMGKPRHVLISIRTHDGVWHTEIA